KPSIRSTAPPTLLCTVSRELLVRRCPGANSIQLVPSHEPTIQSKDFNASGCSRAGGCADSGTGNTLNSRAARSVLIVISGRFEGKDVLVIGRLDAISQIIGGVRLPQGHH